VYVDQKKNDKNWRLTECPSKVTSERNFGTELSSRVVKYTLFTLPDTHKTALKVNA
jgi:hypothetical protein